MSPSQAILRHLVHGPRPPVDRLPHRRVRRPFGQTTILLPPTIMEYVVVNELVHMIEPIHTPEFWTRLERVMPDYEARKKWLAENGAGYLAL